MLVGDLRLRVFLRRSVIKSSLPVIYSFTDSYL
jgi:hypothetical protein